MKLLVDIGNQRLKWAITHAADDELDASGVLDLDAAGLTGPGGAPDSSGGRDEQPGGGVVGGGTAADDRGGEQAAGGGMGGAGDGGAGLVNSGANSADSMGGEQAAGGANSVGGDGGLRAAWLAALAAQWGGLAQPDSVWVSCVARAGVGEAVGEYAWRAWARRVILVRAQRRLAGVVNGYRQPTALGSDRWAALLAAAAQLPRQAVIVVDAGSAVTVDLLDATGQFRGGVIFPGVRAMRHALYAAAENITPSGATAAADTAIADDTTAIADDTADAIDTDAIDTDDDAIDTDITTAAGVTAGAAAATTVTATDTRAAVAAGALVAVAGGIRLAIARQRGVLLGDDSELNRGGGDYRADAAADGCQVLITGGDGTRLASLLGDVDNITFAPDLVLRGLAVIARELSADGGNAG